MTDDSILEADLQTWLVGQAEKQQIRRHITNLSELDAQCEASEPKKDAAALRRALTVCDALYGAKLVVANKSVSEDKKQLRPDLQLMSNPGGNTILVELKAKSAQERQTLTELFAYHGTLKNQEPFMPEVFYVVVTRHWENLLSKAVAALIGDGKYVLPLEWTTSDGEAPFSLRVCLELFERAATQVYNPEWALVPVELVIHAETLEMRGNAQAYLAQIAKRAQVKCQEKGQSGFAAVCTTGLTVTLVLATVNHNWRHSEYTPAERVWSTTALTRLDEVVATQIELEVAQALEGIESPDEADLALAHSRSWSYRVDSAVSAQILEECRDLQREAAIVKGCVGARPLKFDNEIHNLWRWKRRQLRDIEKPHTLECWSFGELYKIQRCRQDTDDLEYPRNLWQFSDLLDDFQEAKELEREGWLSIS